MPMRVGRDRGMPGLRGQAHVKTASPYLPPKHRGGMLQQFNPHQDSADL
jgi:hypothetical protein